MRPFKNKRDEVTIYYWNSSVKNGSTGHIALQTHRGGIENTGYYISFYPVVGCCLLSLDTLPLPNFDELHLPDTCNACYIQIKGNNSTFYYADRQDKAITILKIPQDKQAQVAQTMAEMLEIGEEPRIGRGEYRILNESRVKHIIKALNHSPRQGAYFFSPTRNGIFHSKAEDFGCLNPTPPTATIRLYTLNVDKINSAYEEFLRTEAPWSLFGYPFTRATAKNCSVLTAYLLGKGSIDDLFSLWNKIGMGLLCGATIGGAVGGIAAGMITVTTTKTIIGALGWAIIMLGSLVFTVPVTALTACLTGLTAALIAGGIVAGAAGGAFSEYIYTITIGDRWVTPDDILKFVDLAKKAEQGLYELNFVGKCQSLIDRCQRYSSKMVVKREAITVLKSLLEKRVNGQISSDLIAEHVSTYLNLPNPPIFKGFFHSTVKLIFQDCLDLMNTDQPNIIDNEEVIHLLGAAIKSMPAVATQQVRLFESPHTSKSAVLTDNSACTTTVMQLF